MLFRSKIKALLFQLLHAVPLGDRIPVSSGYGEGTCHTGVLQPISEEGQGESIPQSPAAQNIEYTKVPYFGVMYSEPPLLFHRNHLLVFRLVN